MLISNTLFGVSDKVEIAIARIKEFEPPEGYYVAFSGGKDSMVVLDLVRRSGVKYDYHFSLTTIDPPELIYFIKKNYLDVIIDRPKMSMWQLIVKKKYPPTRIVRYCCAELKERGGSGRLVVTGIRWAESVKRSKRLMVETCYTDTTKRYLHPIIDWSTAEVWQYIHENKLPYCSLYDEGFKRIGCIMCPMSSTSGQQRDAARWPKYAKAYERAFQKTVDNYSSEHKNKRILAGAQVFESGAQMMAWWMSEPSKKEIKGQGNIFE